MNSQVRERKGLMAVDGKLEKIKAIFKKIRIFAAFFLVYMTYNPEGIFSYFHWAIKPWFDGFFGKGKLSEAGPHSLKAFVGVVILMGWFFFLRTTKRKIGAIGILLTVAFFGTLGWVLMDYGLFPRVEGRFREHVMLLIISFILMLGVLLPEPSERKRKKDEAKAKEEAKKELAAKEAAKAQAETEVKSA